MDFLARMEKNNLKFLCRTKIITTRVEKGFSSGGITKNDAEFVWFEQGLVQNELGRLQEVNPKLYKSVVDSANRPAGRDLNPVRRGRSNR